MAQWGVTLPLQIARGSKYRQLDTALNDPRGVVDVEFLHQMITVLLDRLDADAEIQRDLFVGLAFRNQLYDFRFACGQSSDLLF